MQPIAADRLAWSVCVSVCLFVTFVNPAKTADRSSRSLGGWIAWAQWTTY